MVLKVKMSGSGNPRDPYRVDLPTHSFLHGNITQGYAIVFVPPDVHGLTDDDLAHEKAEETTEGIMYPELCAKCLDKLHANLDKRYAEHKGEYRIKLA